MQAQPSHVCYFRQCKRKTNWSNLGHPRLYCTNEKTTRVKISKRGLKTFVSLLQPVFSAMGCSLFSHAADNELSSLSPRNQMRIVYVLYIAEYFMKKCDKNRIESLLRFSLVRQIRPRV